MNKHFKYIIAAIAIIVIICGACAVKIFAIRKPHNDSTNTPLLVCDKTAIETSSDSHATSSAESKSIKADHYVETKFSAEIKDQKETMEQSCMYCGKQMFNKLFCSSILLEKCMGIAKYPYENKIVGLFDLHVKKCPTGCAKTTSHRDCYLKDPYGANRIIYFEFCREDFCYECRVIKSHTDILTLILKSLRNSSEQYEFSYIYKVMQGNGINILLLLCRKKVPWHMVEEIRKRVLKCEFKGKKDILSGLRLYMLPKKTIPCEDYSDIAAWCSYLSKSSHLNKRQIRGFWKMLAAKYTTQEDISKCITNLTDHCIEKDVYLGTYFLTKLLISYINLSTRAQKHNFIIECLCSDRYSLPTHLDISFSTRFGPNYLHIDSLDKLPMPFTILNEVEKRFKTQDKHLFGSQKSTIKYRHYQRACLHHQSLRLSLKFQSFSYI
ncbi:hypothetical protein ENBRE01_1847 [Enteropsectra breve]|nr:hypothetical protein ENBRE01_1847 [Enteropsectra breve]